MPQQAQTFDQGVFLMHLNRGRQLLEGGRLREARLEMEEALKLRPRDESALNYLGMIYYGLDMRPEASMVYRHLLEIHPEADVLHSNLGVLEFKDGRYDDARRRLETALLLNPANARPHVYLGLIERQQGNLSACLGHLRAAGADDLIQKLGLARAEAAGRLDDADTGPMMSLAHGGDWAGEARAIDLRRCLELREGSGGFTVRQAATAGESDVLQIVFEGEVRVRAGCGVLLHASSDSLRVGPPEPSGMILLKGSGRIDLVPTGGQGRPGRVLCVPLSAGQEIQVAPGRLLAIESDLQSGRAEADRDLTRVLGQILTGSLRIAGQGTLAVSAGPRARAVRVTEGELLLIHPKDLVCWTGAFRARPAGMGRLDQLLATGDSRAAAVTLEGSGEILIDTPA